VIIVPRLLRVEINNDILGIATPALAKVRRPLSAELQPPWISPVHPLGVMAPISLLELPGLDNDKTT